MGAVERFWPTRTRPWDGQRAKHLLERAGFGGGRTEVEALVALGPREAVASLLHYQPARWSPPTFLTIDADPAELRALPEKERRERVQLLLREARQAVLGLKAWWLERMVTTTAPLEEKLTLFWHGHFATEAKKVKSGLALYHQLELFRQRGKGSFRELLRGVSRDPAMLLYLDNHLNRKGRPNENYARELMELFTLGIGNYTEADVLETARAFTGWTLQRTGPGRLTNLTYEFKPAQHDEGQKTILGQSGNFGGDEVIDLLLAQPAAAPFMVRKLWRYFVSDRLVPADEPTIEALAARFRDGYQVEPLLEDLLGCERFYAEEHLANRIKSPVELVVGSLRRLQIEPEEALARALVFALDQLGQDLLDPPNVAGWAGGREWINTSTLLQRYNLLSLLLNGGRLGGKRGGRGAAGRLALDLPPFQTAAELLDQILPDWLAAPLPPAQRDLLQDYLATLLSREGREAGYRVALHLVTSTPNYQVN
ncbi:MAG: DUF1800 domain-containing protein [Armatimonadetes bacterium]|nr:DUF1800 domain-containing protein [Armatimonadota bacterium]